WSLSDEQVFGPFSGQCIKDWVNQNYFPDINTTVVRKVTASTSLNNQKDFVLLSSILPQLH
ncbi:hypothetical protein HK096_004535, partial [Nowakowskiella sp. JEL0078]